MGFLPIIEKGQPVSCHADWPTFYMNDFSKLGLAVTGLAEALDALRESGYAVVADERGNLVEVENAARLPGVFAALTSHGVTHELTDLVSCVYQG